MEDLRLFFEDEKKLVSDLEMQQINAVLLATYEKYRGNKGFEQALNEVLNSSVKALEGDFQISYMKRNPEMEMKLEEAYARFWIHETNLDVKTFIDASLFDKSIRHMIEDGYLQVHRLRGSVTQGEVAVYCNGEKLVQYGNEMWLRTGNGIMRNGHKEVLNDLEPGNYGEIIGGWGSIKTAEYFAESAVRQYPEKVHQALMKDARGKSVDQRIGSAEARLGEKRAEKTKEKDLKR